MWNPFVVKLETLLKASAIFEELHETNIRKEIVTETFSGTCNTQHHPFLSCSAYVVAQLNKSLNATSSPPMAEPTIRFDLQDLESIGTDLPESSEGKKCYQAASRGNTCWQSRSQRSLLAE